MKIFFIVLLVLFSNLSAFSQGGTNNNSTKKEFKLPPFYLAAEFGIPLGSSSSSFKNLYDGSLGIYLGKENQAAIILELGVISPAAGYLGAGVSYSVLKTENSEFKLSENEISIAVIGSFIVVAGSGHGGSFGTMFTPEVQYLHRFTNLLGVSAGIKFPIRNKEDNIPFITIGVQFY